MRTPEYIFVSHMLMTWPEMFDEVDIRQSRLDDDAENFISSQGSIINLVYETTNPIVGRTFMRCLCDQVQFVLADFNASK